MWVASCGWGMTYFWKRAGWGDTVGLVCSQWNDCQLRRSCSRPSNALALAHVDLRYGGLLTLVRCDPALACPDSGLPMSHVGLMPWQGDGKHLVLRLGRAVFSGLLGVRGAGFEEVPLEQSDSEDDDDVDDLDTNAKAEVKSLGP